jgi:hypothetical protein
MVVIRMVARIVEKWVAVPSNALHVIMVFWISTPERRTSIVEETTPDVEDAQRERNVN